MADPRWIWDTAVRRFRDASGRFISERRALELRDTYIAHRAESMRSFIGDALGSIDATDVQAWRSGVARVNALGWRRVENTLITEYVYGRGGINAMTAADRVALQGLLSEQRTYWRGFMSDIRENPRSVGYIANRANLYTEGSRRLHERARAASWQIALPTHPGEQECGSRCKCRWVITDAGEQIEAEWRLGVADHCPGCVSNSQRYNPWVYVKPDVPETVEDGEDMRI